MMRHRVLFIDGTSFETDDPRDLPPSEILERRDAERAAAEREAERNARLCRAEQEFYCATVKALCEGRGWPR